MTNKKNPDFKRALRVVIGGRTIAYYKALADVMGSAAGGLFLSQLLYWDSVNAMNDGYDGWFDKTDAQLKAETGLSKFEHGEAKKKAVELKVVETKLAGMPAHTYYRVDLDLLAELLNSCCPQNGQHVGGKPGKGCPQTGQHVDRSTSVKMGVDDVDDIIDDNNIYNSSQPNKLNQSTTQVQPTQLTEEASSSLPGKEAVPDSQLPAPPPSTRIVPLTDQQKMVGALCKVARKDSRLVGGQAAKPAALLLKHGYTPADVLEAFRWDESKSKRGPWYQEWPGNSVPRGQAPSFKQVSDKIAEYKSLLKKEEPQEKTVDDFMEIARRQFDNFNAEEQARIMQVQKKDRDGVIALIARQELKIYKERNGL